MYSFRYNSQIKCFWTPVNMNIFSCFGMWNSGPKFVHTFQLHPVCMRAHKNPNSDNLVNTAQHSWLLFTDKERVKAACLLYIIPKYYQFLLHSIYYRNEGTPLSVSDANHYIIFRILPDNIFNIFLVFMYQWEIQTYLHGAAISIRLPTYGIMYPGSQSRWTLAASVTNV
jgi:hypothetical protein